MVSSAGDKEPAGLRLTLCRLLGHSLPATQKQVLYLAFILVGSCKMHV